MNRGAGTRWDSSGLDDDASALLEGLSHNVPAPFCELGVERSRALTMFNSVPEGPHVASVVDHPVAVAGGEVIVRCYRPVADQELPAVLYLHGGGWAIGSLDGVDAVCRTLAVLAHCAVFSVDYRQAPEHPYPVPLDDSWSALRWLSARAADLGVDDHRLVVAGDSAGGNLAAALALRAASEGAPRLSGALLVHPVTEPPTERESYRLFADAPVLTTRDVHWFWQLYLGKASVDAHAAPMRAESLAGMPPTAVLVADHDPLRDDGEAFAARIAREGGRVWLKRYLGAYHGFFGLPGLLAKADEAVADAAACLTAMFTGAGFEALPTTKKALR